MGGCRGVHGVETTAGEVVKVVREGVCGGIMHREDGGC